MPKLYTHGACDQCGTDTRLDWFDHAIMPWRRGWFCGTCHVREQDAAAMLTEEAAQAQADIEDEYGQDWQRTEVAW